MEQIEAQAGMRAAILAAATALFAERGFEGTSLRDITDGCGAKRSLILYHFGSKEALWREALTSVLDTVNEAISRHPAPGPKASEKEKVAAVLHALVDTLVAVPAFGQIIVREGCAPSDRLDWIVKHFTPSFAMAAGAPLRAQTRMRSSVVRDLIIGGLLGATALGPFLEASASASARIPSAGIFPMNQAWRDELVALLVRVILD